jgi:hypothetical protein
MKKRLLCSILLLSLVTASGCGKDAPKQTESADTQATESVTEIKEDATATADAVPVDPSTANEDAETQDEYPSISKVTYDMLFTLIDKEELREFAYEYMQDNAGVYLSNSYRDNFEVIYMGSLFEAYGVPETENYVNSLTYFYKVKYTIDEFKYCQIAAIDAENLTLKEEGKFDDIQFYDVYIQGPENGGEHYPYDDAEFSATVKDNEIMAPFFDQIGNNVNPSVGRTDKDLEKEFMQAFVDGTLSREAKYDSTSEDYNPFFEGIIASYDLSCKEYINREYPELSGKNTGTFSQG